MFPYVVTISPTSGNHVQLWCLVLIIILSCTVLIHSRSKARSASVRLFFSTSSAVLARSSPDFGHNQTLIDLLRSNAKSLFHPHAGFFPVPWLPCGNAQTIYTSVVDNSQVGEIEYDRTLIRLSDGGTLALDVVPSTSTSQAPVLLVTHGLTGGSHEAYVRAVIKHLSTLRIGCHVAFTVVVLNSRGCNGTPVTTPKLSHAGVTDDIRHAILWISASFPASPIYGLGFSVGANALTKYAGEEGDACPLSAVVSVANVWDFVRGSHHIEQGPLFSLGWFYSRVLGSALRNLLLSNREAFQHSPYDPQVSPIFKPNCVTLRRYHATVTSPMHGFAGADDYYAQISSARFISTIRIPMLGLNAADDPVTGPDTLPICDALTNPWIVLAQTDGGGHLGWFERGPDGRLCRWFVKPIGEFLEALLDYNLAQRPQVKIAYSNNTVSQQGRPDISYTEVH